MACHICGGDLEKLVTDLPLKVAERPIVIIKGLPVLQCSGCSEYVLEDPVMEKVDAILARVDTTVELEILSYVAWKTTEARALQAPETESEALQPPDIEG